MKRITLFIVCIFLVGSSVGHAETNFIKGTMITDTKEYGSWTASDHMGAVKRFEEESRLLQAEARGMENIETLILPYLQVKAVDQAGVNKLIDRRLKEADEMMKLAKWHHQEALVSLRKTEASMPGHVPSQKAITTGTDQSSRHPAHKSFMRSDWMEEEDLWGW